MDISNIEAFLAIVETQSLLKASEKLFLSQSTVSNRLDVLEEELGVQLIKRYRGKRFITLTSKGEEFMPIARRWMSLKKDTNVWANQETSLKLNIGSVDSLNTYVFPPLFKKIISNESQLKINVSSHWSNTVFGLLESYEIDMGLVPRLIKTNSLVSEPIFSEKLVLVSDSLVSSFEDFVHPQDLDLAKEIGLDWGPAFQIWHDIWWDPNDSINIAVDTAGLIFNFIDIPGSWAIVTENIAHIFKNIQPIKISELIDPPPERTCYKIKHRNPLTRAIEPLKIFENNLNEFIKDNPFIKMI
ncbi:LysR family transcriptional regulator [Tissierella praeacuta]|uniref:LysR family transcriptional regulator n=1 Tax=Tissierella praeacuta TaxID=43131 RepID=UPI001C10E459|nr:LysR family transcriptional regulator [Tissierella praeacuta]MBU5256695.1 LysR family transcriptional regulator [Tissierella praeacuta]